MPHTLGRLFLFVAVAVLAPLTTRSLCAQARTAAKPHTHGQATLDIGIEGLTGTIEFRAPGDDLYGFEHEPRNATERARRDAAFATLRSKAASLVIFDSALGCALSAQRVGVDTKSGDHGDVIATYSLTCRRALAGRPIGFGFSRAFPEVHSVKVQLVSDTAQVGLEIVADKGTVRP
ncbi:MAG: DUF2796 domain-containing protein [Gemmatimonadaceae bacterium]|nr:DUF2796 domain-containing protein [Gemmatimonadaceae bacterium]MCC6430143.1 DUF2796 domain-containing protein [Gemmatimonadaceae bacterium]